MLINNQKGSYFLLGELFLDIELEYDLPFEKNLCGSCNRCMEACPTNAIISEGVIDANKCISYFTIESKTEIPEALSDKTENYILGCDICQDVCPWNKKFSFLTTDDNFKIRPFLENAELDDFLSLDQDNFSKNFKNSPIKRAKLRGFLRNVISVISASKDKKFISILEEFLNHEDELIREQARISIKIINGITS